ncbi:MAG TPA: feruloyl-CoA synthase [Burkholderiales bacterium]|nr:feruloyl-CoA synthase [Burkholderiales bacterium]
MKRAMRAVRLGSSDVQVERKPGGAIHLRSPHALAPYPRHLLERLRFWAEQAPARTLFAQRSGSGWRKLTYGEALERARRIGQALLDRELSAERPLVVLSGNDIEHGLLHLGAMYAGIPYAPISPAYSLLSHDFAKLRSVLDLLTPGLVYASDRKAYGRAIDALGIQAVHEVPEAEPTQAVERAHAQVGPDTIAKFLFTSGSTGRPKAVINTQRMWCANQVMARTSLAFVQDEPPVLVEWAPWHHTAGGNKDLGLCLYNGGSLYIDEGKPVPGAIETTVRNLREIAPTFYFNVPKGYEALLPYLREDEQLRRNFFGRVKMLWFAGAGVSQAVFDEYRELSYRTCGEEILFGTGLGSTETAPFTLGRTWDTDDASNMGVPPPGVDLKLVPVQDKYEARIKGPHITPGYWREPELTRHAFDEEGYYRLGDTFVLHEEKGLLFRGRLSEDFKLATGTWVQVGELRARLIEHFMPLLRDVVIAGEQRAEPAALVFANSASREELAQRLKTFAAQSTGSSNLIRRMLVLEEPPSLDAGEMTDKGSINQRAVLARRAALVEELYSDSARVIRA